MTLDHYRVDTRRTRKSMIHHRLRYPNQSMNRLNLVETMLAHQPFSSSYFSSFSFSSLSIHIFVLLFELKVSFDNLCTNTLSPTFPHRMQEIDLTIEYIQLANSPYVLHDSAAKDRSLSTLNVEFFCPYKSISHTNVC